MVIFFETSPSDCPYWGIREELVEVGKVWFGILGEQSVVQRGKTVCTTLSLLINWIGKNSTSKHLPVVYIE